MTSPASWTFTDAAFLPSTGVPVTDRGFRYGMSVFETFALRSGRLLLASAHWTRLERAAAAASFILPAGLSLAAVQQTVEALPDGLLRLYVTAGDGAPLGPVVESRSYLLYDAFDFSSLPGLDEPFAVALCRAPLPCPLGGWKTGNYWAHVQALAEGRAQGASEALVFNTQGALVSASMANVFLGIDGRLQTPALPSGARDGAVRSWVCETVPVESSLLTLDDVERAEECFITNSRLGVQPVSRVGDRSLPSTSWGRALGSRYREEFLRS